MTNKEKNGMKKIPIGPPNTVYTPNSKKLHNIFSNIFALEWQKTGQDCNEKQ
jgi:hypothetical protein